MDFAPISRDRSMRVTVAAGWLVVNAVLFPGLLLLTGLLDPVGLVGVMADHLLSLVLNGIMAVAMFASGVALYRRLLLGGYGGLFVYGLSLVLAVSVGPINVLSIVISVLGVAAILSAWEDLEAPVSEFSETIDIAASAERIWEVMADVTRWPEWTASITSVTLDANQWFREGTRARIRQPGLPPATWVITELDPRRGFTWVSRSPGVKATARHAIEPSGAGCTVTLSVRYEGALGPLVAWLFRGKTEQYLLLEAHGLKRRVEERARETA